MAKKMSSNNLIGTDKSVMKIIHDKLTIGDFLQYKDLVDLIGLDRKAGKSKQLQLEDLRRFIDYEYDSEQKKYFIIKIFDKPEPKSPRKLRSDAIYTKYIEMLLLSKMKENDGVSLTYSKKMWWVVLSMVNDNYIKYGHNKNTKKELLDEYHIDTLDMENINAFYKRVDERFRILFDRALNSLYHRGLIEEPEKTYIVRYSTDEPFDFHIATEEEKSNIADCRKNALLDMGLSTDIAAELNPQLKEQYYKLIAEYEYELYDMVQVYKVTNIIHGKKYIDYELNYTQQELRQIAQEGNTKFKENIDNEALNSYKKKRAILPNTDNIEMDEILDSIGINPTSIFDDGKEIKNYVDNQLFLSDKLIKI